MLLKIINVKLFIIQTTEEFLIENFFTSSKIFGKEIGGNHGKD